MHSFFSFFFLLKIDKYIVNKQKVHLGDENRNCTALDLSQKAEEDVHMKKSLHR